MKKSLIVIALFYAGNLHAAGFDCKKASTKIEKMICSDSELFVLDGAMAQGYKDTLSALPCADDIKTSQKTWLVDVRNKCTEEGCLKQAYNERIAFFKGLAAQPAKSGDITGTYSTQCWGVSDGAGGELRIKKQADNKAQFQLECNKGAPSYNIGTLEGTLELNQQGVVSYLAPKTEYSEGRCEMEFDFTRPGKIKLTQKTSDIDCGFGNGVSCDNVYELKNTAVPEFTPTVQ